MDESCSSTGHEGTGNQLRENVIPLDPAALAWKFSIAQGSSGNSLQSAPGTSLGGYLSTTVVQSGTLNNVFSSVNQDQLSQNSIDCLCLFLHNTSSTVLVTSLQLWLGATSNPNFSIAAAVDNVPPSIATSPNWQATTVATRFITPQQVGYFIFPENQSESLKLPDLPPNHCVAVWFQRTLLYSGPIESESIALNLSGVTAS